MAHLPAFADVRVSADAHDLSVDAARASVQVIRAAVIARGRCSVALSGGETPRALYRLLGSTFRDLIPWQHVDVFWGDERYVPHDHPESNYKMASEALLKHVPCGPGHVHPIPTDLPTAEDAAREYERTLRQHFGTDAPAFDLNLLGIGEDGHTASIFPGSPALTEDTRWVVGVEAPAKVPQRITMTLAAIIRSANLYVLVSGGRKAHALRQVLAANPDANRYPAAGLRRARGPVIWWADREAAEGLAL